MSYTQPFNLPSLQETFRFNTKLLNGLVGARFTSVVPVMMIPQGGLQEYHGIGPSGDADATRMLLKQRLIRHNLSEKMTDFIKRQFNSVVEAPISVLQVAIGRDYGVSHPVFSPLDSITMFEKYEPHMCVQDLINMTKKDVLYVLEGEKPLLKRGFKQAVRDPKGDARHIQARLESLGLEFTAQPIVRLHAVNR